MESELSRNQKKKLQKETKRLMLAKIAKVKPRIIVHPVSLEQRVLMTDHEKIRFIMSMVKPTTGLFKNSPPSMEMKAVIRRMAREVFGTQEPVIRVRGALVNQTGSGGAYVPVVSYYWGGVIDQASWAAVFDEVKVLDGVVNILPIEDAATNLVFWAVDYDNATALGSEDAALAYDTHQIWNGLTIYWRPRDHIRMAIHPQGIPDKSWIDTTDTTTVSAYVKGYATTSAMSIVWFRTYFEMNVKFRQVN
jgi:hypothetical protein